MTEKSPAATPPTEASAAPAIYAAYREWAAAIPEGSGETATVAILEQLAHAADASQLSDPWTAVAGDELDGRVIVVQSLKRMPSDYQSGLGFYLVVSAADANTGEALTFTTGSVGIVGQLIKAHHEGWLPMKCELIKADRPTAKGYYPQHLRVYGDPDGF